MAEVRRQLKIKTGSVRRLAKELIMYTKDKHLENIRVENLKAAKGDASDIKHAVSLATRLDAHATSLLVCIFLFSFFTLRSGASSSRSSNDDSGHTAKA